MNPSFLYIDFYHQEIILLIITSFVISIIINIFIVTTIFMIGGFIIPL